MYYWGIDDETTGETFEMNKAFMEESSAVNGAFRFILGKRNVQDPTDKFVISIYRKPGTEPFARTKVEREPIAQYEFRKIW